MKRLALAIGVTASTFILGVFAVAIAQKDSRNRDSESLIQPKYASQTPEPIDSSEDSRHVRSLTALETRSLDVPPPPAFSHTIPSMVVRANDGASKSFLAPSPKKPMAATRIGDAPNPMATPILATEPARLPSFETQPSFTSNVAPIQAPSSLLPPTLQSDPKVSALLPPPLSPTSSMNPGAPNPAIQSFTPGLPTSPSLTSQAPFQPTTQPLPSPQPLPSNGPPVYSTSVGTSSEAKPSNPNGDVAPAVKPWTAASNDLPTLPRTDMKSLAPKTLVTNSNAASAAQLSRATPGERLLDGAQNPSLQLHKRAPEEVQVGQPSTFSIIVRNVGNASAHEVVVLDRVPRGARLSRTNPNAEQGGDGSLIWSLGEMAAGSEQTLSIELIPESEGELGSVASVTFASQASVRTVSTQPRLEITANCQPTVLLGDSARMQVQVTNKGTGMARHVRLEEDVPPGLRHPLGPAMDLDLGDLAPGQSQTIPLELMATEPGTVTNRIRVLAVNAGAVEALTDLEVIAPKLMVTANGPRLRYLERQATYQLTISNQGTAMARNVALTAYLPRGMQFNGAGNQGGYVASQHAAQWELEELAPGQSATTDLVILPVEEGDFVLRMQCQADGIRAEPVEKPVRVEGQSELAFSIEDDNDPVEVDGETLYTIKLTNSGTRIDRNVLLMLELPAGCQVLDVMAPVAYQQKGNTLAFEAIQEMKAKDQQVYRVSVRLSQEGTHVARAHLKSELRPTAVINEESTRVYADR